MDRESVAYEDSITRPMPAKKSGVIRFLIVIFLIAVVFFVAIIAVLRHESFQLSKITVVGTKTFPAHNVTLFSESYLSGMYGSMIPKSSSLLFSKDDFARDLQTQFPVIDIAYITFPEPHELLITIKEKDPKIVWCFSEIKCGFVNEQGILYAEAPHFSEGVYLVFASETPKKYEDVIGGVIIEPAVMNRFFDLFINLRNENIMLSKVLFEENGDIAFYVEKLFNLYPTDTVKILGTIQQDDALFLRDMQIGLAHEVFQKQFSPNPKGLQYIDLRFSGKVFYKFNDSKLDIEQSTTEIPA